MSTTYDQKPFEEWFAELEVKGTSIREVATWYHKMERDYHERDGIVGAARQWVRGGWPASKELTTAVREFEELQARRSGD